MGRASTSSPRGCRSRCTTATRAGPGGRRTRVGRRRGVVAPGSSCIPGASASSCAHPSIATRARWCASSRPDWRRSCFLGDDAGDLAAFDALDALGARRAVRPAGGGAQRRGPGRAARARRRAGRRAGRCASSCSSGSARRRRAELVVEPWRGRAGRRPPRAAHARGRRARTRTWSGRCASTSAVPATSNGLTSSATSRSSSHTPASRLSASTPSCSLSIGPSLATRFSPSRTGLTSSTS